MGVSKDSKIQLSFGECVPGIDAIEKDLLVLTENNKIIVPSYPIQVDLGMLTICHRGKMRLSINLKEYDLVPGSIMVAMPDQVLQEFNRSDDFSASYVGVSRKLINEIIPGMPDMLTTFMFIQENPQVHLTSAELEQMNSLYSFISTQLSDKNSRYYKQTAFHLISTLFYTTFNIYFNHYKSLDDMKSRQDELFEMFIRLVHTHFKKERSVSFYARQLNITPKYLSQTIKYVTGKTAGDWIDLYVILEAKMLLRSSDESILEISKQLNFPNQSFFGKYFKQHVGISPKDYRKQIMQGMGIFV